MCLDPADSAEQRKITVAFYNLKNHLLMDRRVSGGGSERLPKPEEELEVVLKSIAEIQPDVLVVCEIGDERTISAFQAQLEQRGVLLPHSHSITDAAGHERNLAILSSLPFQSIHSRDRLSYRLGGTLIPHQRGILDVSLKLSTDESLRILGLHLKSKREVTEGDQQEMRRNEARLTREHLDELFRTDPDAKVLLLGDLNALRHEPAVRMIQGISQRPDYLRALTLTDDRGARWTHHWSYADAYSRFDFALYSRALSRHIERDESYIYHRPDWWKGSDHRPIVVVLEP